MKKELHELIVRWEQEEAEYDCVASPVAGGYEDCIRDLKRVLEDY